MCSEQESSITENMLLEGYTEGIMKDSWWNKVLDLDEAIYQILFSLPVIITNVSFYLIPLISVMFAGHLGELELAASTLANSWATLTGFAFMIGLSGAVETLCGQGYGAQLYKKMGIYLQASCIRSFLFSIIISILWIFSEPILIYFHQDPQISKRAAIYLWFLIPGIFAFGFLHNILRYLQTQSIVTPLVIFSVLPLFFHVGIAYSLTHLTELGFEGAALAASISLWLSLIMIVFYILSSEKFMETWKGFSFDSFQYVFGHFKLAISSAAMVCLEYWAFEFMVLMSGLMKNAEIQTSLIAMCVITQEFAFMFTSGLSAAASTRVSNELGAGKVDAAKRAMVVTLKLSIFLAFVIISSLVLCHSIWASFFTHSSVIINKFASMMPFLIVSIVFDSIQGVLSGVARGCGWQDWAVCINLATYYLIAVPVAVVASFKYDLNTKGLWIGLMCGLACQAGGLLLLTRFRRWTGMKASEYQSLDRLLLC